MYRQKRLEAFKAEHEALGAGCTTEALLSFIRTHSYHPNYIRSAESLVETACGLLKTNPVVCIADLTIKDGIARITIFTPDRSSCVDFLGPLIDGQVIFYPPSPKFPLQVKDL